MIAGMVKNMHTIFVWQWVKLVSRGVGIGGRKLLSIEVLEHRLKLMDEIIAMLAPNINRQRNLKK